MDRPERYRCRECGKLFPAPKMFHLRRFRDNAPQTMCIHCLIDYLIPQEQDKLASRK